MLQHCRRTLLPVLSKRWSGLLQGPDPAWSEVTIDTNAEFPADPADPADSEESYGSDDSDADDIGNPLQKRINTPAMVAWFSRREGSVNTLRVHGYKQRLPESLMMAVLTSQAASLRELDISLAAAKVSSADLPVLVALTGLESLKMWLPDLQSLPGWDDHSAAFIGVLSQLPALWAAPSSTKQGFRHGRLL